MWNGGVYFPQCPEEFFSEPLLEYYENLKLNEVFSYGDSSDNCPKLILVKKLFIEQTSSILVITKSNNGKYR